MRLGPGTRAAPGHTGRPPGRWSVTGKGSTAAVLTGAAAASSSSWSQAKTTPMVTRTRAPPRWRTGRAGRRAPDEALAARLLEQRTDHGRGLTATPFPVGARRALCDHRHQVIRGDDGLRREGLVGGGPPPQPLGTLPSRALPEHPHGALCGLPYHVTSRWLSRNESAASEHRFSSVSRASGSSTQRATAARRGLLADSVTPGNSHSLGVRRRTERTPHQARRRRRLV